MDDGSDQVDELILEPVRTGRPSRPRGLWAVLAVVAVTVGAVAVSSAGDDDPQRPGLPVALGASVAARDTSGAADAMLAWVTYVPGDDLPALGGEAPAYRLSSSVSEDQVRDLADALGLGGRITRDGSEWRVSDTGGTLAVADGGTATWWYSSSPPTGEIGGSGAASGSAGCAAGEECTTVTATAPCPPDGDCATVPTTSTTIACGPGADCVDPDCAVSSDGSTSCADVEQPYPPADLPSGDEARDIALDLLASTGVDLVGAEVTVDGPYDAWYVTVEPLVDGVPSGLVAAVTVGSGGTVRDATGSLAVAELLGDYPLLDTRATIDRANSHAGSDAVPALASDTDAGTSSADAVTDTTVPMCKPQADGREICELISVVGGCEGAALDGGGEGTIDCTSTTEPGLVPETLPECPQAVAPVDEALGAPETIDCPAAPDPGLVPEPLPTPLEIVLVDAVHSLAPLTAVDGSTDVYLVPAYRFTDADGGRVDLPAVADSTLTTPPTTDTSAVDPAEPPVVTVPATVPCELLVEDDGSGTTHTIQPDPACADNYPGPLPDGEEPQIGVGYYVDVHTEALDHCGFVSVEVAGTWWWADDLDDADWAVPTEGGTLTLVTEDRADFIGDAAATKTATLVPFEGADGERPLCD